MRQPRCPLPPSSRGLANLRPTPMMDLQKDKEQYPTYHRVDRPDGLIDVSSSENTLMLADVRCWLEKRRQQLIDDVGKSVEYGSTAGSPELREAIAAYTNRYFDTVNPVLPGSIIVGNGVSSLLSTLAFNLCDAGEAIMLEVPNYGMFEADLTYQNGVKLVFVQTDHIKDRFSADCTDELILVYHDSLQQASREGVVVRAVLLCNPCNPIGRCYSKNTLIEVAQFCHANSLHLVADEIYALSGGISASGKDPFTSMLSLRDRDGKELQDIHFLSGASKDFGLGGLRLGWLITRNENVWKAVRRLAPTTWVTSFSDRLFTRLLSDSQFMDKFVPKLQQRLEHFRNHAANALRNLGIPFENGNAGLFLWIDLSKWVSFLSQNTTQGSNSSPEMDMSRYLMEKGLFLQPDAAFFSQGIGKYRLVYTANELDDFDTAMSRLGRALEVLTLGG